MLGLTLRITGRDATLILAGGATTAAVLGAWSIRQAPAPDRGVWILSATLVRLAVPAFFLRPPGLAFTAPRPAGFWYWPVRALVVEGGTIRADLDPPEQ